METQTSFSQSRKTLVLSRQVGEVTDVMFQGAVVSVEVLRISGRRVKLQFVAPEGIDIRRDNAKRKRAG